MMSPDTGEFSWVKIFNGESDSSGIIASLTRVRVVHGRPHNAHPTAKINKVKDLALIFFISVFTPSSLQLLSKTS